MQKETQVHINGKFIKNYPQHIEIKEAILFARQDGFLGRLEIYHILKDEKQKEEVVYGMYIINQKNDIVGAIFPFQNLSTNFLFDKTIPTKSK